MSTETDDVRQPVPWRVELVNRDTDAYDSIEVSAVTEDDACHAALEPRPSAWDAYRAEKLCIMCDAAPHAKCDAYSDLLVVDPERVPLGEDYEDHLVPVPVCAEHLESMQSFLRGES